MLAGQSVTVIARLGMGLWEGGGSRDILATEHLFVLFHFQRERQIDRDPRAGTLMYDFPG